MFSRNCSRAGGVLLLLGLSAALVGCGGAKARATVKGKVTFGGKALTVGTVMFWGDGNQSGTGVIDKEGNYVVNDAPLGEVKISVTVPKTPPGGLGMMKSGPAMAAVKDAKSVDPSGSGQSISIMGDMPANVVAIPAKFESAETSGLTYKVERGEHTHDLTLTP